MAAAGFSTVAAAVLATAGCTSAADQRAFEGTRWRVEAMNGEATPPGPNYRMEFAGGRISGQLGCNHLGGDYQVRGDLLTAGPVAMTEMACSGPAGHFESLGTPVLTRPMTLRWISAEQLTLANSRGSIALSRLP